MTMMIRAVETECAEGMAHCERRFLAVAQHSIKVCDADCLEGLAQAELRYQAKAKAARATAVQPAEMDLTAMGAATAANSPEINRVAAI